jgi:hypothetical protein
MQRFSVPASTGRAWLVHQTLLMHDAEPELRLRQVLLRCSAIERSRRQQIMFEACRGISMHLAQHEHAVAAACSGALSRKLQCESGIFSAALAVQQAVRQCALAVATTEAHASASKLKRAQGVLYNALPAKRQHPGQLSMRVTVTELARDLKAGGSGSELALAAKRHAAPEQLLTCD